MYIIIRVYIKCNLSKESDEFYDHRSSYIKNKGAIRKALINLLDNNEIENISVTEIAQEADITRKTFYTYYDSYEKLIDELENDLIEMFEKPINKMEFSESAFNPQLIFETLTDLVRENLEFYQHFMLW